MPLTGFKRLLLGVVLTAATTAGAVGQEPDTSWGWPAPVYDVRLEKSVEVSMRDASSAYFGKEAMFMGEGGSIPFMGMLGQRYPQAQFLITGLLGPGSNAHGPNEFLHIPTGKSLTCCVAQVLRDHALR